MTGWIKISRELPNHWIWKDADRLKWWLDLLFMASWDDSKQIVGSRLIEIKRGQLVASIAFLVKRWGINHNTVINFLKTLKDEGMITKTSVSNVSIITICNYEKYQETDNLADELTNNVSEQCAQSPTTTPDNLTDNCADNFLPDESTYRADNLADSLKTSKSVQKASASISKTDNVADNVADSPADTNKEYKNNINNNTTITRTRERIEELRNQLLGDQVFWEGAAMSQKVSIELLKELFQQFINEKIALDEIPNSYTDFRRHFFSWSRIAIARQARPQYNETKPQDRYNKRRGADSEARSAEDYTGEI